MSGFTEIDESMVAGARIVDADVDASAAINPIKIAKRSMFISIPLYGAILTGGAAENLLSSFVHNITFDNATAGTATMTAMAPRTEVTPGDIVKLHMWIVTAATSGMVRFVVDIKPAIEGTASLSSAIQKAIIADARSGASEFIDAIIEFPAAIFTNAQSIGIKIARDPANSLDTIADNVRLCCAYLEMQGRC